MKQDGSRVKSPGVLRQKDGIWAEAEAEFEKQAECPVGQRNCGSKGVAVGRIWGMAPGAQKAAARNDLLQLLFV